MSTILALPEREVTDEHLSGLRCGRDVYSRMRLTELRALLGATDAAWIEAEVAGAGPAARAFRWRARGLSLGLAIRKVRVDDAHRTAETEVG